MRSEAEITVGATDGCLCHLTSTYAGDKQGPIPAAYPKGYNSFYCMKYDISQGQYADFLNKLTSNQCKTRYNQIALTQHYTLEGLWPEISASKADRACNYLSWADLAGYLDWAALRPMTELEFEKACRGPERPVANEYPWGTTKYVTLTSRDESAGSGHETALPTNANVAPLYVVTLLWDLGPCGWGFLRVRVRHAKESGSGYYGVMDLGGSVTEPVISAGHATGRAFTGVHGDGQLSATGNADVDLWPKTDAQAQEFGEVMRLLLDIDMAQAEPARHAAPGPQNIFTRNLRVDGGGLAPNRRTRRAHGAVKAERDGICIGSRRDAERSTDKNVCVTFLSILLICEHSLSSVDKLKDQS